MQNSIKIQDIKNSKVLVRVSFDLPSLDDTARISDATTTIKQLLSQNNKVILCSKWGKIKNGVDPKFSFKNMLKTVDKILLQEIFTNELKNGSKNSYQLGFVNQFEDFKKAKVQIENNNSEAKYQIFLLENTHFDSREKSKDASQRLEIAKEYANLADFFVDEAFPSSHRTEATNTEIKDFLPNSLGLSYSKEIHNLNKLKEEIQRPYMVVMAGSKLETKLPLIQQMLPKADKILLGGMLAFTFIQAAKELKLDLTSDQNKPISYPELFDSQIEENFLDTAKELLQKYPQKLILPLDFVYGQKDGKKYAFDVGLKTLELYETILKEAKTLFWNGTLGYYEQKPFDQATLQLAEFVGNLENCFTAIGGGDTNSSLPQDILQKFSFISMGGGATLEYLSK